ncbi:hypothetical protein ABTF06_19425, partial [Acinetobacter baumannii]
MAVTVENAGLTAGQEVVSYTVAAGDSLTSIATGIAKAINADAKLQAIGVGANSAAAVVNLFTDTFYTTS